MSGLFTKQRHLCTDAELWRRVHSQMIRLDSLLEPGHRRELRRLVLESIADDLRELRARGAQSRLAV